MTARRLSFGYHPHPLDIQAGPVAIAPLANHEESVAAVEGADGIDGDWIYAPLQGVRHLGGGVSQRPYPARIFGLPKTHSIEHASPDNQDQIVFHLWALSFFTGMRLTPTEAGFVDATPIKPGKLVDFVLLGRGLISAVELAEAFWITHRTEPRRAAGCGGDPCPVPWTEPAASSV